MYTWSSRLSAVLTGAAVLLSILTVFNFGTHLLIKGDATINLAPHMLYKMGKMQLTTLLNSGELLPSQNGIFLHFNLSADFTNVWTWATYEIFVMVIAEYTAEDTSTHSVVIWDKIITSKDKAILKLEAESPEYAITDKTTNLEGANIKLVLKYELIPYAGAMVIYKYDNFDSITVPQSLQSLPYENSQRTFYAPNTRPY